MGRGVTGGWRQCKLRSGRNQRDNHRKQRGDEGEPDGCRAENDQNTDDNDAGDPRSTLDFGCSSDQRHGDYRGRNQGDDEYDRPLAGQERRLGFRTLDHRGAVWIGDRGLSPPGGHWQKGHHCGGDDRNERGGDIPTSAGRGTRRPGLSVRFLTHAYIIQSYEPPRAAGA